MTDWHIRAIFRKLFEASRCRINVLVNKKKIVPSRSCWRIRYHDNTLRNRRSGRRSRFWYFFFFLIFTTPKSIYIKREKLVQKFKTKKPIHGNVRFIYYLGGGSTGWLKVLPSCICWKFLRNVSPPGACTILLGSPASAGSSSSFSDPEYLIMAKK